MEVMSDHHEHGTVDTIAVNTRVAGDAHGGHAQSHVTHVADGAIGNQFFEVGLCHGGQCTIQDAEDSQQSDKVREFLSSTGSQWPGHSDHPISTNFQKDSSENHTDWSGGLNVSVGQPGVEREAWEFDAEADQEEGEDDGLDRATVELGFRRCFRQLHNVKGMSFETRLLKLVRDRADFHHSGWAIARPEVENQDGNQNEDRAEECVEQEFDGGVFTILTTPDADQEVHRQEHDFKEDIEQEEVE